MPLYLKNHSQGEYVFDHAWAEALERAGGDYYPKLQGAVPFTPVTGRRLLARNATRARCWRTATAAVKQIGASSLHVTFYREEWQAAGDAGYLLRTDQQFHWENAAMRASTSSWASCHRPSARICARNAQPCARRASNSTG